MKKYISILAVLLMLSLTACSNLGTTPTGTGNTSNTQSESITMLDEGVWPVNEYTEGLPVPSGTVAWAMLDTEHENCSISIVDIDESAYNEYMELLKQEGFSVIEDVSEEIKGQDYVSNLIKECDSMKKKLPIILLGVILACVLVFGFLYANNDIGKTANSLEADIRQSQKILDDWIVDGSISDTMAAFISYPQDKTDHTFSVYVNRPGLSFGYFFRGGGDIVEVDDYIAEFVVEGNNERAFISMNTQNIVRLEVDDGNGIQVIDIDSGKPFAIVLPLNVGNICFYDTNGNVVEYLRQQL